MKPAAQADRAGDEVQILEFGALLVGEEVRFTLDVEAIAPVALPA